MKHTLKMTAMLLSAALLLTGCCPAPALGTAFTISEPVYPEMPKLPQEEDFRDPATGKFDIKGYQKAQLAWDKYQQARAVPLVLKTETLEDYFLQSIPAFISGTSDNAVCSPLNIYMALALLAESTDGAARQEILDLINVDSLETLRDQASKIWNAHYLDDGTSACILANSLWLNQDLDCNQETADALAKHYFASVFRGEMGSDETNQHLQEWINAQTGGLLKDQAAQLKLDPETVLSLASTIYYRAKWGREFDAKNNTEQTFHATTGDKTTTFMNKTMTQLYYWDDNYGAVLLPMADGSKMWLILPDEGYTPDDLLTSGQAMRLAINGWKNTQNQKPMKINLSLPKFDVGSDESLEQSLQQLGVTTVFDPINADFSPILPSQAAWLNAVNHAARVKIDEQGVEAAAYTVMAGYGAPPISDEIDFVLDRPFLFLITSQHDLPLFAGVVNNP